jgi:3-hydroxyisobutyrate dehydrogenase
MQDLLPQTVGVVGSGTVAKVVAQRLSAFCRVVALEPHGGRRTLDLDGVDVLDSLEALAKRTSLVLVAEAHCRSDRLPLADELAALLPRGSTIVNLMAGDPAQAQDQAKDLAARGIAFVDAPIHCEQLARFPEHAAFLCGGPAATLADLKPLLERIGAKVVLCGDVGAGHAARAVVAGVALCNRLVTLESAAMGYKNGLSVTDMATVLNRCSGANSGTARVLPAMPERQPTADTPLAEVAAELALCSQIARRVGAPVLIANDAASLVRGASRALAADATMDDLRSLVEIASTLEFGK